MNCPLCGTEMKKTRIGGGRRRETAYICPVDEMELYKDANGHIKRRPEGVHPYLRVWRESELLNLSW